MLLAGLLAGMLLADVRGAALQHTTLGPRLGHDLRAQVVLLDTPRATRFGWRASAGFAGERVLLQGDGRAPAFPAGRVLDVRGVLRAPRPSEDWLRPKRLHAVLEARVVLETGTPAGRGARRPRRGARACAGGAGSPPARSGGRAAARHGSRRRRGPDGGRARSAAPRRARAPRGGQRGEHRAARGARGRGRRGARDRPARAAGRGARADRALRAARGRRPVDPARRRDGRRGARGDARGAARREVARRPAGRRRDAVARSGCLVGSGLAAELRRRRRDRAAGRSRRRRSATPRRCRRCSPTARR